MKAGVQQGPFMLNDREQVSHAHGMLLAWNPKNGICRLMTPDEVSRYKASRQSETPGVKEI